MNSEACFNCGQPGSKMFGYPICDSCKKGLRLFTDPTLKKYVARGREKFHDDIKNRLELTENDYIKKRIKLLHILDRLNEI